MEKTKRQQIWDQMNKQFGNDGLCSIKNIEVITSGSHALNDVLGLWGLPKGRIVQYAGKESCGKTMMSLICVAEWQKLNPENWVVFIDAEFSYDESWARMLGVDTERLFLIKENNSIKIFDQLVGVPNKELGKPKTKLGILDLEKENPSGLGIIVLDSIAALQTPIAMTKEVGSTMMAPLGRFLPDALPRITPLLSQTGVIFIVINQVRVDIGKLWGDPESTPGGKALKHYCSTMVHFARGESSKSFIYNSADEPIGHFIKARIDKNRTAPPRRVCEFTVNYTQGVVDKHIEIAKLAVKYGVITRPNNRTYIYGDKKWSGEDNFYQEILNEDLEKMLEEIKIAKLNAVEPIIIKDENESGDE